MSEKYGDLNKNERLYYTKTIKKEGAHFHLVRYADEPHWKLHKWDGPSIEPFETDSPHEKAWYLNGIEYSEYDYQEAMRNREGLPWFKNPAIMSEQRT